MTEQQVQSKKIKELEAEGYYVLKYRIKELREHGFKADIHRGT